MERMSATAFRRQWLKAKEEVRLMRQQNLELIEASAKADALLDGLYEGVIGQEAPDLAELREVSA